MRITSFVLATALFFSFIQGSHAFPVAEVRVLGVPTEFMEPIKTASGVFPGDEYEPLKVERGAQKIQDYLEGKGYPQAELTMDTPLESGRHYLDFKINLGSPLRMAFVAFKSKDQTLPPSLVARLTQAIDLKPGEIFDRDRVKEMRRLADSVLFSQNFIDSKVVDLTTETSEHGINLIFWLEMGQKVILSVSGNEYYSRTELMSFIEEQRAQGLGHDFVNVLVNRLRDQYVDQGFKSVKITPYSFEASSTEAKKIVFDIEEGKRVFIKQLIFDGNEVFKSKELQDFFYDNAQDRIVSRIYNEKMVDDAAKGMINELKKRGYLFAKLIAIKLEEVSDSEVNLRFFVNEGLQTRIQAIEFRGNRVFESEQLVGFLGLKEGDPLSLIKLEDGLEQVKKQYRNLGYLNFKIDNEANILTYSDKNQYAYLNLEFSEGQVIKLARFDIFGNENTRRIVIEREFRIRVGEPLSEAKTTETEEHLRRLGIFSQVNLEFKDSSTEPDAKDMRVSVEEVVPGNRSVGIGFRNDLGVRVFGELSYANLWGMNHTWALDVAVNRRIELYEFIEYNATVSYTWPWAIFGETTFRPSLSTQQTEYIDFNADTYALSLSLDRMLFKPIKLSGGLTYTLEKIRQFGDTTDTSQNTQIQIGSITPSFKIDLRDNPLVPRDGAFIQSSFEYACAALGSQSTPFPVSYWRYQGRIDYYANFIPHFVWFNSVRGGYLKNLSNPYGLNGVNNQQVQVPLIKQFFLGGINSIRGFPEQAINAQSINPNTPEVQGYETYINYRTQIDFFPSTNLSMGPFLDSGNLQTDAFSLGNLRYGTGVGLHYLTPVGPINFDWGFNLFPRPGEAGNVFYFSLGVI